MFWSMFTKLFVLHTETFAFIPEKNGVPVLALIL